MIIKSIEFENFGVYSGKHTIDFSSELGDQRNVVVVRGQNGSGKTTILEALMLGLMGSLSLDDRVKKQDFKRYLASRVHTKKSTALNPHDARVQVAFNFLMLGIPSKFLVSRSWAVEKSGLSAVLDLNENGNHFSHLSEKEKEQHLRQVISAGIAKVVFFDGEQLQQLNSDAQLNDFVAESCRAIFGLNLMETLNSDIQHFSAKLKREEMHGTEDVDLSRIKALVAELKEKQEELIRQQSESKDAISLWSIDVKCLEEEITMHGIWDNDSIGKIKADILRVKNEIPAIQKAIAEHCAGLTPFAIARGWLSKLANTLDSERTSEREHLAESVIQKRLQHLLSEESWKELLVPIGKKISNKIIHQLQTHLVAGNRKEKDLEQLHQLIDKDRDKLLSWIQTANAGAIDIQKWGSLLAEKENQLRKLEKLQESTADQEVIAPKLDDFQNANEALGRHKAELAACEKELEETRTKLFHAEREAASFEKKLSEDRGLETRLGLAHRTQLAIKEYSSRLLEEKLKIFAGTLVQRFNELCRKPNYLDAAIVDPNSFHVQLFKNQQEINQSNLSAGERQLLGISVLWALRDMTRISLPLVIDTPMGRLDSEHRRSMLEVFLPSVSHQVIVLGTDEEIDQQSLEALSPFLAKVYEVCYDDHKEESNVVAINFPVPTREGMKL